LAGYCADTGIATTVGEALRSEGIRIIIGDYICRKIVKENKFDSILENIAIADSLPPCSMPEPDSSIEFPNLNATHVMKTSHTEGKRMIK
jgi:hypothetical protein